MTILSNHVNMMAVQMCAKSGNDNDVKPDDDQKMGTNTKNPVLTKTVKKEKDWCQTLSAECITSCSSICPIVTVKSLDISINPKIQVELNLHAETCVVGATLLLVHDHAHFIDVFGYDSKSIHKNITTFDAALVYDNTQTGDM